MVNLKYIIMSKDEEFFKDPYTPEVRVLFKQFQQKLSELAEIENDLNSKGFDFPPKPPKDYSRIEKIV
jgi:hypothetical protein